MTKIKDTFFYEFIKSIPFKLFIFTIVLILMGMYIQKCNTKNKVVRMQEEVLYIKPTIPDIEDE